MVVDADRQFVEYVPAGMARRLLKGKQASVHRKSPFIIQLAPGVREVPEPAWNATRSTKMSEESQNSKVTPASAQKAAADRLNRRRLGYSWNEYFVQKDDGEVWVQNISDMQISLDIEVAPGVREGTLIPPTPDPLNLTEEYGFEILKKSANFRRTLAKRKKGRPILILLDAEQVEAYYEAKARHMGAVFPDQTPDIDAAMDAAAQARRQLTTIQTEGDEVSASNLHGFAPPKSAQELIALDMANRGVFTQDGFVQSQRLQAGLPSNLMQQGSILLEEVVNPKVLNLCQQVNPQIPENMRMRAEDLFAALQSMQATLTLDDYQHIEAHGTYRTIKRWARQKVSDMASGEEGLPDGLSLEGQGQVAQVERQGALGPAPSYGPAGPASLAQRHGMTYQGPGGFANAPFKEAFGSAESMTTAVLGPDGSPMT